MYDALGLRILRRDPWHGETRYDYDRNGDLRALRFPGGQQLAVQRNAIGEDVRRTLPGGAEIRSAYGLLGELRAREVSRSEAHPPAISWQFHYDEEFEVVRIDSQTWGLSSYDYDRDGYLLAYRSTRALETYRYDAAGNRLNGLGEAAVSLGNRLERWMDRRFVYDSDGRLIRQNDSQSKEWQYLYTASGRLREAIDPSGRSHTYQYDPFGRRITKSTRSWPDALLVGRGRTPGGRY